jgi:uncharacterized phage protein gp47/JayE
MSTNSLTAAGLTIQTFSDVVNEILNGADGYPGLLQIYPGISVSPNTPDGNMVNIYALGKTDVLQLVQQVYDSFDPDQAVGVALDSRCAINGITRNGGTYTQQNVLVTVSQALTLPGLDLNPNGGAFTVQDSTGTQYQLVTTHSFTGSGSASLAFQAVLLGAVQSAVNTITTVVTVQLGVVSVNNPTSPTSVGVAEENDTALRIRRANSVEIPNQGYANGLYAGLLAVPGITAVKVLENITNTTDSNGVPAHGIWVILAGLNNAAVQVVVASVIYLKRPFGVPMKGSITIPVSQPDGNSLNVSFDFATAENLYFRCSVTAITGSVDKTYIAAQVLAYFGSSYTIYQAADATSIVAYIKSIAPNASVTSEGVSTDGSTYSAIVTPSAVNYQFVIPSGSYVSIS